MPRPQEMMAAVGMTLLVCTIGVSGAVAIFHVSYSATEMHRLRFFLIAMMVVGLALAWVGAVSRLF